MHSDFAGKGAEGERQLDAKPYGVEGGMQAASEKLTLQRKPEPAARARGACVCRGSTLGTRYHSSRSCV